jgi:hypothetical protein
MRIEGNKHLVVPSCGVSTKLNRLSEPRVHGKDPCRSGKRSELVYQVLHINPFHTFRKISRSLATSLCSPLLTLSIFPNRFVCRSRLEHRRRSRKKSPNPGPATMSCLTPNDSSGSPNEPPHRVLQAHPSQVPIAQLPGVMLQWEILRERATMQVRIGYNHSVLLRLISL